MSISEVSPQTMTARAVSNSSKEASSFVLAKASELGFVRAGITGTGPPQRYSAYQAWLDRGDHGNMAYMAQDFHRKARRDMRELLPEAQSAIVVALSYPKAPTELAPDGKSPRNPALRGRVAQYALGEDYHRIMHGKLRLLADALSQFVGKPLLARSCVDSAPLLERELAERAGLGFVGKNTMLISPGVGSYTLLGVLLSELALQPTHTGETRDCGTCRACLDACPTQAFGAPYQLDAKRCISYLTIESPEPIPEQLRSRLGDRIFGCDLCQEVCPHNARAPERHPGARELQARSPDRARPPLRMLAELGSNQRKHYLKGSAMRRMGRDAMLRNVAVALGNLEAVGEEEKQEQEHTLRTLAEDKSSMVREHASWALDRTPKR